MSINIVMRDDNVQSQLRENLIRLSYGIAPPY